MHLNLDMSKFSLRSKNNLKGREHNLVSNHSGLASSAHMHNDMGMEHMSPVPLESSYDPEKPPQFDIIIKNFFNK